MRNIIDTVEAYKWRCQKKRSATDDHNLTLQSHLYEISHYKKQIYACQEFKTPELDKVVMKASERGDQSEGQTKLANLSKGISELNEDFSSSFAFMEKTFQERKDLSVKLAEAEKDKQAAQEEYKKKEQLLDEFPKILATLEEATHPIQEYLDVQTSKEQTELNIVQRLPKPLATLYEKLSVFAKHFSKFEMNVKVKGASKTDSESNPDIEQIY